MTRAVLVVWACVATVLAIHFATREPPPVRVERRNRSRTAALERRVRELQTALAAAIPPSEEASETNARVDDLLARYRAGTGGTQEAQDLIRDLYGRIATDPSFHMAVMETLAEAKDDDAAFAVVELLVLNPFTKLARNSTVTAKIRDQARELMTSGTTWQRDAAARILFGYADPSREDVLVAIEQIDSEADAAVRDTLLEQLSDHAKGIGITEREAAPFVDALRDQLARGETWTASAIADWSADEADLDRLRSGFRESDSAGAKQDYLNGFRADSRMGGRRADACRTFLLDVLESPDEDEDVRSLALDFLKEYAPWDAPLAERIRRTVR